MSPRPVIKMTGTGRLSPLSVACSSRPDRPDIRMSAIRHEDSRPILESRNSSAEPKHTAGSLSDSTRSSSASRSIRRRRESQRDLCKSNALRHIYYTAPATDVHDELDLVNYSVRREGRPAAAKVCRARNPFPSEGREIACPRGRAGTPGHIYIVHVEHIMSMCLEQRGGDRCVIKTQALEPSFFYRISTSRGPASRRGGTSRMVRALRPQAVRDCSFGRIRLASSRKSRRSYSCRKEIDGSNSLVSSCGRPRMNIHPGQRHQRRSSRYSIPAARAVRYCPSLRRQLLPCKMRRLPYCCRP
jgi:hypothetical protein